MLNDLYSIQNRIIAQISTRFQRALYKSINWDNRLILLKGSRGTGKTTLVLQHFLEAYNDVQKCLYISADNPLVLKQGIYKIGVEFFKYYGNCLIVDEVHKQKDWSIEIKGLYDAYPGKRIIVLGSSALNIMAEKGDLSRRAVIYTLPTLSFREFLEIKYETRLKRYSFSEMIADHTKIAGILLSQFDSILGAFSDYLINGGYPFSLEHSRSEYLNLLANILDKIIYEDIPTLKAVRSTSSLKLKKLLAYLATSKIPLFNIESLKTEIAVSKDTLYEYFDLLERAEIVNIIRTESKNVRAFKNSKILFSSPNIYHAIAHDMWKSGVDKGNIRESFFASQLREAHWLYSSMNTDFLVIDGDERYEIEVGGKSKKKKQVEGLDNALIFKDDIEIGTGNSIPLYLAGFLN